MQGDVGFDQAEAGVGIAIEAVMRTGVIGADVDTAYATAILSLALGFFNREFPSRYFGDPLVINAFSVGDPQIGQVDLLGTGLQPQTMGPGDVHEFAGNLLHGRLMDTFNVQVFQVSDRFCIKFQEADNAAIGIGREFFSQGLKLLEMKLPV